VVEEEVATRLDAYGEGVDTRGEGVAVIVFNSLGWARTDLVTVKVGFAEPGVRDVRVLDPAGETVAAQIIQAERSGDGALIEAETAFLARDVPALGHSVYHVLPVFEAVGDEAAADAAPEGVLESDLYHVTVDPSTGAIGSLVVKDGGWEALRDPANVVVQEADHGDLWEPYKPLDGGSRIAMAEPHPVPPRGAAVYSDEQAGEPGRTTRGSVLSEVTTSHPFGERGHVVTTIRVIEGLQRVEVRTRLIHRGRGERP
jgi:alpha-mannosidase